MNILYLLLFILTSISSLIKSSISPTCTLIDNTPISRQVVGDGTDNPVYIAYSPNGKFIATANYDSGSVSIYPVNFNGSIKPQVQNSDDRIQGPRSVAFSNDSKFLAIGDQAGNYVLIYAVNADGSLTFQNQYNTSSNANPGPWGIAYSPDGTCLAVANNGANTVSFFPVNSDGTLGTYIEYSSVNFAGPISVSWSMDGTCLAVGNGNSDSGNVTFLTIASCGVTSESNWQDTDARPVWVATFSPIDNNLLILGGTSGGLLLEVTTSSCSVSSVSALESVFSYPYSIAFSPDGNCVVVANGDNGTTTQTVQVVPLGTPTSYVPLQYYSVAATYSPDGKYIAIASYYEEGETPATGSSYVRILRTNLVSPPTIFAIVMQCDGSLIINGVADVVVGHTTTVNISGSGISATVPVDENGNFSYQFTPNQTTYTLTFQTCIDGTNCSSTTTKVITLALSSAVRG